MLDFLLEEPSAEAALEELLPSIHPDLQPTVGFNLHVFRGKPDLLRKLPSRLAGYSRWAHTVDMRLLVLVDRDDEDCAELKQKIKKIAKDAGLPVAGKNDSVRGGSIKICVACEELEAWFLGDPKAIHAAFPRIPATFATRAAYRDPDAIRGGTWERLEKLLQDAGYYSNGLRKIEVARIVSKHMTVTENNSKSFNYFCESIRHLMQ